MQADVGVVPSLQDLFSDDFGIFVSESRDAELWCLLHFPVLFRERPQVGSVVQVVMDLVLQDADSLVG